MTFETNESANTDDQRSGTPLRSAEVHGFRRERLGCAGPDVLGVDGIGHGDDSVGWNAKMSDEIFRYAASDCYQQIGTPERESQQALHHQPVAAVEVMLQMLTLHFVHIDDDTQPAIENETREECDQMGFMQERAYDAGIVACCQCAQPECTSEEADHIPCVTPGGKGGWRRLISSRAEVEYTSGIQPVQHLYCTPYEHRNSTDGADPPDMGREDALGAAASEIVDQEEGSRLRPV